MGVTPITLHTSAVAVSHWATGAGARLLAVQKVSLKQALPATLSHIMPRWTPWRICVQHQADDTVTGSPRVCAPCAPAACCSLLDGMWTVMQTFIRVR
jgi:hypothetical protein